MDPIITVAIIGGGATVASGILAALISNSIMKYRIQKLEEKVDKHNNLIERMYIAEGRITTLEHDIGKVQPKGV